MDTQNPDEEVLPVDESSADGDEETLGTDEELPMGDSEEATEVDATDDEESEDEE